MRKEGEAFYQEKHKLQKKSGRGIFRQEKVAKKHHQGRKLIIYRGCEVVLNREKHGRGAKKHQLGGEGRRLRACRGSNAGLCQ